MQQDHIEQERAILHRLYQDELGTFRRYIKKSRTNLLIMPLGLLILPILLQISVIMDLFASRSGSNTEDSHLSLWINLSFLVYTFIHLLLSIVFLAGSFLIERTVRKSIEYAVQKTRDSSPTNTALYVMRILLSVIPPFSALSVWLVWSKVWILHTNPLSVQADPPRKATLPWWMHVWGVGYAGSFLVLLDLFGPYHFIFAAQNTDGMLSFYAACLFLLCIIGLAAFLIAQHRRMSALYQKS